MYPWGNAYEKKRMNIWQGKFPKENKGKDGYIGVAPAKAFKPQNSFGESPECSSNAHIRCSLC